LQQGVWDVVSAAHAAPLREVDMFEKRVRAMARDDKRARLMMSAPGVGPIVAFARSTIRRDCRHRNGSDRILA
jgi:transposase